MSAITWGGVSLPGAAVDGIRKKYDLIGSGERMADGTLKVDVIDHKWGLEINWQNLTATQRTTLRTQYDANRASTQTLLVGSDSWTVSAARGGFIEDEIYIGSGGSLYNVKILFEEV